MKKLFFFVLAITMLLLFSACESGGTFMLHNNTSHPVWTAVQNGNLVEVAPSETRSFKINTESQSFLTGEVSKRIKVNVFGKTFSLVDVSGDVPVFTDSTYTRIKVGKTTHAYLSPNRACIEIHNARNIAMQRAEIWQIRSNSQSMVASFSNLEPTESKWIRVEPSTATNSFYYRVSLLMENGDRFDFGGPETVLNSDDLFMVTIPPPPGY